MFRILALLAVTTGLHAATLERLSLDDMTRKSSDVVRATVVGARAAVRGGAGRGGMVYTWYTLQVSETLKGSGRTRLEVAVPGGAAGRVRQTIAGAPQLKEGDERVFFIWTSRSGLPQIIGLAQGLFEIRADSKGKLIAVRHATAENMLDPATGRGVRDTGATYGYEELKRLVRGALEGRQSQ